MGFISVFVSSCFLCRENIESHEANLESALAMGRDILSKCHPDAVTTTKHWLSILQVRESEKEGKRDEMICDVR